MAEIELQDNRADSATRGVYGLPARWYWERGRTVLLESTTPPALAQALLERGHEVTIAPEPGVFGRGQIIWRLPSGAYVAGSEGRTDGAAVGY